MKITDLIIASLKGYAGIAVLAGGVFLYARYCIRKASGERQTETFRQEVERKRSEDNLRRQQKAQRMLRRQYKRDVRQGKRHIL
jgi:hypothetical protein